MFVEMLTTLLRGIVSFGVQASEAAGGGFWLPRRGSELAAEVDSDFALVYWISVFFFALIVFLLFFFVMRFRAQPGEQAQGRTSHSTGLELFWSIIPTLLVVLIFWQGFRTYLNMATPPPGAYEVQVSGQKWNWLFTYPNGYVDAELHVAVDTPVTLVMSSNDVIHSFFIPDFRVKNDVIPGRYSKIWFEANVTGEYEIFCAEYCGTEHSTMLSKLIVHEVGGFEDWLAEASDFLTRLPPAEAGEMLYKQRGCPQCHTVDGTIKLAPTFLGLYGSTEQLADGNTVLVDENYVRESIYEPLAKVTAGYEPVMPTYRGRMRDEEIDAIIEYLKTLTAE